MRNCDRSPKINLGVLITLFPDLEVVMSFIFQGAFDGLVGESPYIGKGRFKQHQRPSSQPPTQQEGLTQMDIDRDMMEKMHDALDRELAEKQAAIDKGQGQR